MCQCKSPSLHDCAPAPGPQNLRCQAGQRSRVTAPPRAIPNPPRCIHFDPPFLGRERRFNWVANFSRGQGQLGGGGGRRGGQPSLSAAVGVCVCLALGGQEAGRQLPAGVPCCRLSSPSRSCSTSAYLPQDSFQQPRQVHSSLEPPLARRKMVRYSAAQIASANPDKCAYFMATGRPGQEDGGSWRQTEDRKG